VWLSDRFLSDTVCLGQLSHANTFVVISKGYVRSRLSWNSVAIQDIDDVEKDIVVLFASEMKEDEKR
jgi:hypothetical protein